MPAFISLVAMEACCGAHHLGRQLAATPCVSCRPNMRVLTSRHRRTMIGTAEAVAEAATRPTMRFVEIKSEAQLDMQTLHRARERLVAERTALINQVRSVLLERGIAVA
jgi:transposase